MEKEEVKQTESVEPTKTESDLMGAIDQMKAENDRRENILRQEQELAAKNLLSGRTDVTEEKAEKEETPQEYKDRVLRGEA